MEKKKRRIKITDLPRNVKVSQEEMKTVVGGISITEIPPYPSRPPVNPGPCIVKCIITHLEC